MAESAYRLVPILLSTGVDWHRIEVPGLDRLLGRGVLYGASRQEAHSIAGKRVFVIGGGNSAGQAAVFFSNYAAEVIMLVRGVGLALSMSRYLITQIAEKDNIRIEALTEVTAVQGEEHLEQIVTTTRDSDGGHTSTTRDADALFLMIGATANTSWLPPTPGARRQRLYLYWKRPDRVVSRTRAVSPGDEPSRHILCGRRSSRFDQTRSERRRRRQHVDRVHPSIPGAHRKSRSYPRLKLRPKVMRIAPRSRLLYDAVTRFPGFGASEIAWNHSLRKCVSPRIARVRADEFCPQRGEHERRLTTCRAPVAQGPRIRRRRSAHAGAGHWRQCRRVQCAECAGAAPAECAALGKPVHAAARLREGSTPSQSYPDYRELRDRNHSFESLMTNDIIGGVGLDTGSGNPSVVWPYMVSGNYFDSLGVQPYLGRFIHASDEHGKNSVPYIVLSYAYWHSHFNSDPAAVGRAVQINKHPYTIVGVAPPEFRGTELFFAPDLWAPIVDMPQIAGWDPLDERGDHFTWVIGHLKPGVTPAAAASDLNIIAASMAKSYPKEDETLKFSLARPGLVGDTLGRPARAFMAGLMLLAGLILLAACANLGSLFAARAADRSREIAVRMALDRSASTLCGSFSPKRFWSRWPAEYAAWRELW